MAEEQTTPAPEQNATEGWQRWEGQLVDGRFPLRQYLGGSERSAVFLTERDGGEQASIKLVPARWGLSVQTPELSHPHLIRIFHTGKCQLDDADYSYCVMEYSQQTLSQVLAIRPLAAEECLDVLAPVLDAVAYIHEKGFAHGRLKPANILAVQEQLKVSSDGLQSQGSPAPDGASAYDAPELASTGVSAPGDVWSLGITVLEALNQRIPTAELIEQRPIQLPEGSPSALRDMVTHCLDMDPRARWTVTDLRGRLRAPAPTSDMLETPVSSSERPAARRYLIPAILVFLLLLGIWAGPKLFNRHPQTSAPAVQPKPEPPGISETKSSAPLAEKSKKPGSKAQAPTTPAVTAKDTSNARDEVLQTVLPEPSASARQSIQGTIKVGVRVQVDSTGAVTGATLGPAGSSKYFAAHALQAARQWKFAPSNQKSRQWMLRFEFRKSGVKAVPTKLNR
jgi:TonB family protein